MADALGTKASLTPWLRAIGAQTVELREALASRHLNVARQCARAINGYHAEDLQVPRRLRTKQKWHLDRATGQRRRIERVLECTASDVAYVCDPETDGCGRVAHVTGDTCGVRRLCERCCKAHAHKIRALFRPARERELAARHALIKHGGWRERFLTLTVPHSGDAGDDVRELHEAWPRFWRRLRAHVARRWGTWRVDAKGRRRRVPPHMPYLRCTEVTHSDAGHAHIHVWLLSPFLSHVELRLMWARSLSPSYRARVPHKAVGDIDTSTMTPKHRTQAVQALAAALGGKFTASDTVPWPVVDVRACREGVEAEVVKYLTKDIERGERVAPEQFARVYIALEARRTLVTSEHLLIRRKAAKCTCGHGLDRARCPKALYVRAAVGPGYTLSPDASAPCGARAAPF